MRRECEYEWLDQSTNQICCVRCGNTQRTKQTDPRRVHRACPSAPDANNLAPPARLFHAQPKKSLLARILPGTWLARMISAISMGAVQPCGGCQRRKDKLDLAAQSWLGKIFKR